MANKLTRGTIDAMFAVYLERQSVEQVAKKCGVSHRTVERYRALERWSDRVEEIRLQAQKQADYGIAQAMADSLRVVRAYKEKFSEAMMAKRLTGRDVRVADFERLVRLEAFVLGAVESRHEIVGEFSGWTDEEVERYAVHGEAPGEACGGSPRT